MKVKFSLNEVKLAVKACEFCLLTVLRKKKNKNKTKQKKITV